MAYASFTCDAHASADEVTAMEYTCQAQTNQPKEQQDRLIVSRFERIATFRVDSPGAKSATVVLCRDDIARLIEYLS